MRFLLDLSEVSPHAGKLNFFLHESTLMNEILAGAKSRPHPVNQGASDGTGQYENSDSSEGSFTYSPTPADSMLC